MDLDSAIQHCKEQVQEQAKRGCYSCAEEHQQLAEWLKELKAYREIIDYTKKHQEELKFDNITTYAKFFWDCWRVREDKE